MTLPKPLDRALRFVVIAILLQTLFFKFSGADESVYIFSELGLEPWGRIGSGVAELVVCALLALQRTVLMGALLSIAIIAGALASHLTVLGVEVQGDGGLLFGLAVVVLVASLALAAAHLDQLPRRGGSAAPREPDAE